MDEKEKEESSGFKIKDRRRFQADGSPIEGEEGKEMAATGEKSQIDPAEDPIPPPHEEESELEADFAAFVFSLAAGAQSALGIAPHPITGQVTKDLKQAKYTIDLLGVLQEKTKGNLSEEEAKLLQAILYDLRMRFIEAKG